MVVHNAKIMKEYNCVIKTADAEVDFANNFIADVLSNNVDYNFINKYLNN